jgi:hypothetical protein
MRVWVGAWATAEGCLHRGGLEDTYHQHVFSGVMDWVPP